MKMVKSLLLGAAAGFVGFAAQAADLPGKAAPASYVKICDTYGAGFYYIPGSNTCLRIGGSVFAQYSVGQTYSAGGNAYATRVQLNLTFDARSQTEYGLLRGFGAIAMRRGTATNGFAPAPASGLGGGGSPESTTPILASAFVQFGPLTAGRAPSFFNFYQNDHQLVDGTNGGGANVRASDTVTNLLAFTGSFGGGFMATISLEDRVFRQIGALIAPGGTTFATAASGAGAVYAGQGIPDIVAALRVEQGWGAVQLMGALHEVRILDGGNGLTGAASSVLPAVSKWGWAVGAGVRLDLNQFARGDQFFLQGVYAQGAVNYAFQQTDSDGVPSTRNALSFGTGSTAAALQYADGYNTAAGTVDLSTSWSIWSSFRHFWTPSIRSALWGGYANYAAPTTAPAAATNGQYWVVGLTNTWSPVRDLDVSVEGGYRSVAVQTNAGVATSDTSWFGNVRIQRNF